MAIGTAAAIGLGLTAVGTGVSVMGTLSSGSAQASAARSQAKSARESAATSTMNIAASFMEASRIADETAFERDYLTKALDRDLRQRSILWDFEKTTTRGAADEAAADAMAGFSDSAEAAFEGMTQALDAKREAVNTDVAESKQALDADAEVSRLLAQGQAAQQTAKGHIALVLNQEERDAQTALSRMAGARGLSVDGSAGLAAFANADVAGLKETLERMGVSEEVASIHLGVSLKEAAARADLAMRSRKAFASVATDGDLTLAEFERQYGVDKGKLTRGIAAADKKTSLALTKGQATFEMETALLEEEAWRTGFKMDMAGKARQGAAVSSAFGFGRQAESLYAAAGTYEQTARSIEGSSRLGAVSQTIMGLGSLASGYHSATSGKKT